jgi:hypothetical protein
VSYAKLATVYQNAGQLTEAPEALATGRAIMAQLVEQFPDWSQWKQDLSWFDQQIAALKK